MKTIKFISTAALMLFMTTINAQTTTTTSTAKTISFGVKGGVNFANVRGDDFDGIMQEPAST
ncbi:hypothetical protein [Flavobacterium sp. 3HN19-14]|uniref:hypothetical protein n=1 Tax=Flavobacterium sp. 3HN19-14 TaxID=3448133 RepID=UPI003EE31968